jgi:hypothetical protein
VAANGEVVIRATTAEGWPEGLFLALVNARLLAAAQDDRRAICPGCPQACVMDVAFLNQEDRHDPVAFISCDEPVDHGLIELEPGALQQWYISRKRVEAFVSSELGMRATDRDEASGRVRFTTWRSRQIRRAVALEFGIKPELILGDDRYGLIELLSVVGNRLCIDIRELEVLAAQSSETQRGGKRYQLSRVKQQRTIRRRPPCALPRSA